MSYELQVPFPLVQLDSPTLHPERGLVRQQCTQPHNCKGLRRGVCQHPSLRQLSFHPKRTGLHILSVNAQLGVSFVAMQRYKVSVGLSHARLVWYQRCAGHQVRAVMVTEHGQLVHTICRSMCVRAWDRFAMHDL